MDCFPTILEVAGVAIEEGEVLDGLGLMPLLEGKDSFERDALFFHYPNYAFHKRNRLGGVVRENQFKLIRRYGDGELELHNLAKDIGERRNLAKQMPRLAARLEDKLEKWLGETGARMPTRVAE